MSIVAWLALVSVTVAILLAAGIAGTVQICLELARDERAEGSLVSRGALSNGGRTAGHRRNSLPAGDLSVIALSALLMAAPLAHADAADTAYQRCGAWTQEQARQLGDVLFDQGAYQRSGECYEAAGEYALANKAYLKAVGPESAATSRQLADQRDQAKALLRQVQRAFHSDH